MEIPYNPQGPIPSVDPTDLRSVWEMHREVQTRVPEGGIEIPVEMYKQVCSPGADVRAVWFRASLIGVLDMLGMLRPWTHEGVVVDAVFKIAATFPMNGLAKGVPRQGLPFDVQEFISHVASSAG